MFASVPLSIHPPSHSPTNLSSGFLTYITTCILLFRCLLSHPQSTARLRQTPFVAVLSFFEDATMGFFRVSLLLAGTVVGASLKPRELTLPAAISVPPSQSW